MVDLLEYSINTSRFNMLVNTEMGTKTVEIDEHSDIIVIRWYHRTMDTGCDERSTGIELYPK